MIRVYFDWNIFSYLRNPQTENVFSIKRYIQDNHNTILLVYSPAHLQDLKRSYFTSETGRLETKKDLEILSDLTRDNCLCYNLTDKTVFPYIKNPWAYFNEIFIDDSQDNLFDFENVFDKDDPLGELWHAYWKLLCSIPTGIEFDEWEKIPKEYSFIKEAFRTTKDNNTFGSLMHDIENLIQDTKRFEKVFKEVRSVTNQNLKINSDCSQWGDPFEYLNILLKNSPLQKNFFDLTTETISSSNKNPSRFDYFLNYYIQLDMFGFNKDRNIPNLLDDATHAFYGAHTDIFVTDDSNTHKKAKALYKQLNISTEVVYSNEFLPSIHRRLFSTEGMQLHNQVEYVIANSLSLILDTQDDRLNPARTYNVEPLLLGYFNRLQVSNYEKTTAMIFYKKQANYSHFMFWMEIETILNKLCKDLGTDSFNKFLFDENERIEIENNRWKGRFWDLPEVSLTLEFLESPFGLTFTIETK